MTSRVSGIPGASVKVWIDPVPPSGFELSKSCSIHELDDPLLEEKKLVRLMLLIAFLGAGCSAAPGVNSSMSVRGETLKVYAMQFVEEIRADSLHAGAFDVSDTPEADGTYRLRVELHRNDEVESLSVHLLPDGAGGLKIQSAFLGSEAIDPGAGGESLRLDDWHAKAAARAARE